MKLEEMFYIPEKDWYKLHSNPDLVLEYPNKVFEWKLTPFTEANLKVFILPETELNTHLKNQLRMNQF